MKIVNINAAPSVCDADGAIRPDVTDLNNILANTDHAEGRNDAIRAYIFALRDLQYAHNQAACYADSGFGDREIDQARRAVRIAFDRLTYCELRLRYEETQDLEGHIKW